MAKQKHILNVVTRSETGKGPIKRLRKAGSIPAVIYSEGAPARSIYFNAAEWEALQKYALHLILLKEGENECLALVKDEQFDFIRGKATHVDFLEVNRSKKLRANIALKSGHVQAAGIVQGGQMEQSIHSIEVECLPDDLPNSVEADVSGLNMGDSLHLRDVAMPEGVTLLTDGALVAFSVVDPNKSSSDSSDAEGPAEPEVIGEKERKEKAEAKAAAKGK